MEFIMSTEENNVDLFPSNDAATAPSPDSSTTAANTAAPDNVQARGAFIVEMTAAGVAVSAALVTEDGRRLATPAVFPSLGYALSQIDEMRALVIQRFDQASQIGVQVLAQQQAQLAAQASVSETTPAAVPPAVTASAA